MNINYFQLASHLKNQLLPCYLVSGNEPMLIQECKDAIIHKAKNQGFLEVRRYEASKEFDVQGLLAASQTLSLFSEKICIELKIPAKPNAELAKTLLNLITNCHADTTLLVISDKLASEVQRSSWYQTLAKIGGIITIWPLEPPAFKQWLQLQFQNNNLPHNPEIIACIATHTEGNLLAASQEVAKLKLLFPNGKFSVDELQQVLTDNARYDMFSFIDICLAGDSKRVIKVLNRLHQEGLEATLLLWALTREVRKLIQIHLDLKAQINWQVICKKHQVWEKRQAIVKKALQQNNIQHLHAMLLAAEEIDRMIKGLASGDVWDALQKLALNLAGCRLFSLAKV